MRAALLLTFNQGTSDRRHQPTQAFQIREVWYRSALIRQTCRELSELLSCNGGSVRNLCSFDWANLFHDRLPRTAGEQLVNTSINDLVRKSVEERPQDPTCILAALSAVGKVSFGGEVEGSHRGVKLAELSQSLRSHQSLIGFPFGPTEISYVHGDLIGRNASKSSGERVRMLHAAIRAT